MSGGEFKIFGPFFKVYDRHYGVGFRPCVETTEYRDPWRIRQRHGESNGQESSRVSHAIKVGAPPIPSNKETPRYLIFRRVPLEEAFLDLI